MFSNQYGSYGPSNGFGMYYQPNNNNSFNGAYNNSVYSSSQPSYNGNYQRFVMAKFIAEFAYDCLYDYVPNLSPNFVHKISSMLDATRLSKSSVLLGMTYLARRKKIDSTVGRGELQVSVNDESRIFLYIVVALIIANKYNDDNTFTNRSWSNATGIPIEELNAYEREWLIECSYDLHFTSSKPATTSSPRFGYEIRPWILAMGTIGVGYFNPHLNIQLDNIYGANDVVSRTLTNGLSNYYCVEGSYRNYEDAGMYQSPTKSVFDQNQIPTQTSTQSQYSGYYPSPIYGSPYEDTRYVNNGYKNYEVPYKSYDNAYSRQRFSSYPNEYMTSQNYPYGSRVPSLYSNENYNSHVAPYRGVPQAQNHQYANYEAPQIMPPNNVVLPSHFSGSNRSSSYFFNNGNTLLSSVNGY